jgi:hypothetical protein
MTAIPYEISIEYIKRMGLEKKNLLSTEYKKDIINNKEVFIGDIIKFISGDRRALAIEMFMAENDYVNDDILYIGRGEAGTNAFTAYNSIAFNPVKGIMNKSKFTIYGSTLESLLVLLNYWNELEKYLLSNHYEENIPSLIVYSNIREKNEELIEIELEHRQLQENTIGLEIERSEDDYGSLEREIDVLLGASTVNITMVRSLILSRMSKYLNDPQGLVKDIYLIAKERYKAFNTI